MGFLGLFRRGAKPPPTRVSRGEHEVALHGDDFPLGQVAGFLRRGLEAGERGVVIATPRHTFLVRQELRTLQSRCDFLDAETTLQLVLVDGRPDPHRFHELVGGAVRKAAARGNGGVRVYGQMVGLLLERNEPAAALDTERLWTLLVRGQSVGLLCTYPQDPFHALGEEARRPLLDEHDAVPTGLGAKAVG